MKGLAQKKLRNKSTGGFDGIYDKLRSFYFKNERIVLLAITALFFLIGYMGIDQIVLGKPTPNIALPIDHSIPIIPIFIIVYLSAFIAYFMPFFLVKDIVKYRRGYAVYWIAMVIAYAVYLIIPTRMDRPPIMGDDIFSQMIALFMSIDVPYNALPSLHVTLPFISALICFNYSRKNWWMFIWAGLITLSTVFVRQHYVLDLVAGLILSFGVYLAVFSLYYRDSGNVENLNTKANRKIK